MTFTADSISEKDFIGMISLRGVKNGASPFNKQSGSR